nr:SH3 domain-containing protein [Treponema socranskii]
MHSKIKLFFIYGIIFCLTIDTISTEERNSYNVSYDAKWHVLHIYKKSETVDWILQRSIKESDIKEFGGGWLITDKNMYYLNTDNHLIKYSFEKDTLEYTGLNLERILCVSADDRYICAGEYRDELTSMTQWGELATEIPCIYDLVQRQKIHIKNFSDSFLQDEIGISLSADYDKHKGCFYIKYNWDTPIPKFVGEISVKDFAFKMLISNYKRDVSLSELPINTVLTAIDKLRIFETEDISDKIITVLAKNTKVMLIKVGREETIGGIIDNWVRVRVYNDGKTAGGKDTIDIIGWCFGGYLR